MKPAKENSHFSSIIPFTNYFLKLFIKFITANIKLKHVNI